MNEPTWEQLAQRLLAGELTIESFGALAAARPRGAEVLAESSAQLPTATLDLDRERRCGFPEVVFGQGKSVEMLVSIFHALLARQIDVLATRIDAAKASELQAIYPTARYNLLAQTFRIDTAKPRAAQGRVAVITAGSSDLNVAEEARETLDWMGVETVLVQDVGVAGPLRLLERVSELAGCDAIVVAAGMEGALPSVVGGHVPCPVIGVPTSVGYGASFGGLAALLSMLNSCAANVTVVNLDAGFKAGYIAGLIATRAQRENKIPTRSASE
jgi:NCAIR mutase (PurE)-related protein